MAAWLPPAAAICRAAWKVAFLGGFLPKAELVISSSGNSLQWAVRNTPEVKERTGGERDAEGEQKFSRISFDCYRAKKCRQAETKQGKRTCAQADSCRLPAPAPFLLTVKAQKERSHRIAVAPFFLRHAFCSYAEESRRPKASVCLSACL